MLLIASEDTLSLTGWRHLDRQLAIRLPGEQLSELW